MLFSFFSCHNTIEFFDIPLLKEISWHWHYNLFPRGKINDNKEINFSILNNYLNSEEKIISWCFPSTALSVIVIIRNCYYNCLLQLLHIEWKLPMLQHKQNGYP